jgi:hypothetical protein
MNEIYEAHAVAVRQELLAEHRAEHMWCAESEEGKRQIARDRMNGRLASMALARIIEQHTSSVDRGRLNRMLRAAEALHRAAMEGPPPPLAVGIVGGK